MEIARHRIRSFIVDRCSNIAEYMFDHFFPDHDASVDMACNIRNSPTTYGYVSFASSRA